MHGESSEEWGSRTRLRRSQPSSERVPGRDLRHLWAFARVRQRLVHLDGPAHSLHRHMHEEINARDDLSLVRLRDDGPSARGRRNRSRNARRPAAQHDDVNSNVGLPVVAGNYDSVVGDVLTFKLTSGAPAAALSYFAIDPLSGQIYTIHTLDTPTLYTLGVNVTNSLNQNASAFVFINVTGGNARPSFTNANLNRSVYENYVGPVYATLNWTDADVNQTHSVALNAVLPVAATSWFSLVQQNTSLMASNGNVTIMLNTPVNYECDRYNPLSGCPMLYRTFFLTLTVTDNGVPPLASTVTIPVNLLNVNEPPTCSNTTMNLTTYELSAVGTQVMQTFCFPDFYDDDKTPLQFSFSPASPFAVSPSDVSSMKTLLGQCAVAIESLNTLPNKYPSGQFPLISVAQATLSFNARPVYNLVMNVSDGTNSLQVAVRVTLIEVEQAPVFQRSVWTGSVAENVPGGVVVAQVAATDPNRGDSLYYLLTQVMQIRYNGFYDFEVPDSLTQQLTQRFQMDISTGKITVRPPAAGVSSVLDYETYVG